MPAKGYRKGQSDNREPLCKPIYTHLTVSQRAAFKAEATARPVTEAKLLRSIVTAHLTGRRPELPHAKGPNQAQLRELSRIGNNLNQLTRQANAGIVPVRAEELRGVLAEVLAAARRD